MLEKKVLEMIKGWYTHRQIAGELSIGITTVSKIRQRNGLWVPEQNRKKGFHTNKKPIVSKLQPYKLIYHNGEVDIDDTEEELSQLDKILDKLQKKWISIGWINYQWKGTYESKAIKPYWGNPDNVLVIGDIHEPVSLDGYLEFCREQQEKYDCWTIIFIGDIVDMNSFSYHEKQPEILNPSWEMALAKKKLADWYQTFPKAKVCMWNHDLIGYRKAKTAWLLRDFIQWPHEMFWAPKNYEFADEFIIDWVLYTHGNEWNAYKKAPIEWMSMVSWHTHTLSGVQYFRNRKKQIFGCQVWTGIDYKKSNFDYARISPKHPILSCAVVLNNWTLPIVIPFNE